MTISIEMQTVLISALATPVVAAIAGFLVNKLGSGAKLREIEYYAKRLELVEKLLTLEPTVVKQPDILRDTDVMRSEVTDVVNYLRQTSLREPIREGRPPIAHRFILPMPRTLGGWIGTIIYYMYAFGALIYLVLLITSFFAYDNAEFGSYLISLSLVGSCIFAALGRLWAMRSFRKWLSHSGGPEDLGQKRGGFNTEVQR